MVAGWHRMGTRAHQCRANLLQTNNVATIGGEYGILCPNMIPRYVNYVHNFCAHPILFLCLLLTTVWFRGCSCFDWGLFGWWIRGLSTTRLRVVE